MQVQTVTTHLGSALGFAAIADGLAVVQAGGYVRLIYASRSDNQLAVLTLASGYTPPNPPAGSPIIGTSPGADISLQENASVTKAYIFSSHSGTLRQATLNAVGQPGTTSVTTTDQGTLSGITVMEIIERGATDFSVMAQRNEPGLQVFSHSAAGAVTKVDTISDGPKSYLGDVADLAHVTVDGRSYLLTASALENGISLFEIDSAGQASFVDALGAGDGLPIGGPVAMETAVLDGQQFVVVAGTISNSLSVLRVNDMGVMFLHDHMIDDRTTRFDGVGALDMFTWAGRAFVVAAGTDSGVTVIELLPGGRLSHMASLPMETGAGLANVTGVETTVIGSSAVILLTDARGDRIHQLTVPLGGIGGMVQADGGTVSGSALDDRMMGGALAETLQGGAGDDFLHDGGANDLLTGGAGADVFVFARDASADRIGDF